MMGTCETTATMDLEATEGAEIQQGQLVAPNEV
jgi:hypothetical protein